MNYSPIDKYKEQADIHRVKLKRLDTVHTRFGLLKFLVVLAVLVAIFLYWQNQITFAAYIIPVGVALYLFLSKKHQIVLDKINLDKEIVALNEQELRFLEQKELKFEDGIHYSDALHPYANDLDIFGHHSLFQFLNRTATFQGKNVLATMLLSTQTPEIIIERQMAIKELSEQLEWRQQVSALAKIHRDNEQAYLYLKKWTERTPKKLNTVYNILSFILPICLGISLVMIFGFKMVALTKVASGIFLANLFLLYKILPKIKQELFEGTQIEEITGQYSVLMKSIEEKEFTSDLLNTLKGKLLEGQNTASNSIARLSNLLGNLDNLGNVLGVMLMNGIYQHHIHVLRYFWKWHEENATKLMVWIDTLAEFEALNCLSNFAFNYPESVFPTLSKNANIAFTNMGHPMISSEKRVCNSIDFQQQKFVILTGSNMSGKSTFLRTLGINMVLAGAGAPVCATDATYTPMPLLASMRQSDSLADSESYFFAEVKRLKFIVDQLDEQPHFILLDEILRGTNSDDKRSGTVGVIHKIVKKNVFGAIATHDLEVCNTTKEYPEILVNKCFEVDIHQDELHFDYTLREGICTSKSATFLMKKMGIIA